MFGRRPEPPPEHAAVAVVEHILSRATAVSGGPSVVLGHREVVNRAVWFCACVTLEDAPTWLIYDTKDGRIGWCRLPDGVDFDDLVEAAFATGAHVDPQDVLDWLQGRPVRGLYNIVGSDDELASVERLGREIRELYLDPPSPDPQ